MVGELPRNVADLLGEGSSSHFGRAVQPLAVMAGLVPAIRRGRVPEWMAGTSPAMTMGQRRRAKMRTAGSRAKTLTRSPVSARTSLTRSPLSCGGHLPLLDDLAREMPPGITALLALPGPGPKRVHPMYETLGVGRMSVSAPP